MRRRARALIQWLLVPLVVLAVTELGLRTVFDRPRWYAGARQLASEQSIDLVFVGSSRTGAAVHVPTFAQEVSTLTGRCPRALNLARGFSTEVEHYLGLRNLFAAHPASLRGVTVFVEAAGGLPGAGRWDQPWAHAAQPWLVVDLLWWNDLPRFWRSAGLSVGDRLHLTLRFALRSVSSTFNRRERIREQLLRLGIPWLIGLAFGRGSANPFTPAAPYADLVGDTGDIRNDPAALQAARDLAMTLTAEELQLQTPLRGWERTVQRDIVELVRRHGGHVVFFDMPLSSVFARVYTTRTRQDDIRVFRQQARTWGVPLLQPQIAFDDSDLPDLWHLSPSLARSYSVQLARDWVDVAKPSGGARRDPGQAACR